MRRSPTVDASPAVGDVKIGSNWKTVLVGGLGAGGKGVYALDVTTPSTQSVLWEFTEDDDVNVGQVVSTPLIGRLKDGRSVAIFGSGYNSSVAARTGAATSATGTGFLFVLSMNKGSTAWTKDSNYWRISLGTNGTLAAPAGVANPGLALWSI